jgi:hypothetical protein
MNGGYAAIIIQNSAGSGKAKEINKRILAKNTLIASIKMPIDLFVGKSSVQTNIYVFKVGEKHEKKEKVKFIDFSNDGYTRSNRKKASNNLRDTDRAKERYEELVNLVRFGKEDNLKIFSENEYYEATIDPSNGADWNKSRPVDTMPTLADFKKTVSDYLTWEVSQILKKDSPRGSVISRNLDNLEREFRSKGGEFREFRLDEIFELKSSNKIFHANNLEIYDEKIEGANPYVVRSTQNNGIRGYIFENKAHLNESNTLSFAQDTFSVSYQAEPYFTGNKVKVLKSKFSEFNSKIALYMVSNFNFVLQGCTWGLGANVSSISEIKILLPTLGGEINFSFMEKFIEELDAYLTVTGLRDYKLTDKEQAALVKFEEFSQKRSADGFENVKVGDLFAVKSNPQLNKDSFKFCDNGEYPYFTRTVLNNGIAGYVEYLDDAHKIAGNSLAVGMLGMQFFYMDKDFYAGQFTKTLFAKFDKFSQVSAQYFIVWLNKNQKIYQGGLVRDFEKLLNATEISIPIKNGEINHDFMANFIKAIEKLVIKDVVLWANKKIEATKEVVSKI